MTHCNKPNDKRKETIEVGYVIGEDFVYPYALFFAGGTTPMEVLVSTVFPQLFNPKIDIEQIEKRHQEWSPEECADFLVKSITTFYKLL